MAQATRLRRGTTFIEVLMASLILSICLLAVVSLFTFSFNLTLRHDRTSIGYNIARKRIETVRQMSFKYAPEGTVTFYYNASGSNESTAPFTGAVYRATQTISSSQYEYNSSNVIIGWADSCLRTVTVTVTYIPTSAQIAKTGTYLARSGV